MILYTQTLSSLVLRLLANDSEYRVTYRHTDRPTDIYWLMKVEDLSNHESFATIANWDKKNQVNE